MKRKSEFVSERKKEEYNAWWSKMKVRKKKLKKSWKKRLLFADTFLNKT